MEGRSGGHAETHGEARTRTANNRRKRIRKKNSRISYKHQAIVTAKHARNSDSDKQQSSAVFREICKDNETSQGIQSSQSSYAISTVFESNSDHDIMIHQAQKLVPLPQATKSTFVLLTEEVDMNCGVSKSNDEMSSNGKSYKNSYEFRPKKCVEDVARDAPGNSQLFDDAVVRVGSGIKAFVHGNYHRYYGYRLVGNYDEDPRIALLEKRWFHNKRCLDIGCNEGLVTLDLVTKFGTKSMTGIDLDEYLIKRACSHLKKKRSSAIDSYVLSQQAGIDSNVRKIAKREMQGLAQTWFVHGNFLASNVEKNSYECITAFSVIKWIHLHGGDDAVRHLFGKIYDLLAPGGRFILEPQPWKSYKAAAQKMKREKMNDKLRHTYFFRLGDLEIRPEDFCTILPEKFNLAFVRELSPPSQASVGFDRTLFMFQKLH